MRLVIAIPISQRSEYEGVLEERTAGTWREFVYIQDLGLESADKTANDNWVSHWASDAVVDLVLAANDLTSRRLQCYPKVVRCTRAQQRVKVNDWVERRGLSWRRNLEEAKRITPYAWCDATEWIEQFARVAGDTGRRLAKALLQQLKIVRPEELAEWFRCEPHCDWNAYFIGSDPHSGDHGMVTTLSAILPGQNLSEAQQIPELRNGEALRIFMDAAWSGGESARRLKCIYTPCGRKKATPSNGTTVWLRFAYLTDIAERKLSKVVEDLVSSGLVVQRPDVSCPVVNRLKVGTLPESTSGLAFQHAALRRYVDPVDDSTMRKICLQIGRQLAKQRPLGTQNIASTIGFAHSLPKAMLPVFIVGDGEVQSADGGTFVWRALVRSMHMSNPGVEDKSVYCADCALND